MKKVYFFGTGYYAGLFAGKAMLALKALGGFQIVGFLDNDVNKIGTLFENYPVYGPEVLNDNSCDMVLIFLKEGRSYEIVFQQLSKLVLPELIHRFDLPLKLLVQRRYQDSADAEIKETVDYILNNNVNAFNQFLSVENTYDEVKWDFDVDMPYIDFTTIEGRKLPMYYPRNHGFVKKNGVLCVENVLTEQSVGSPHLYMKENHTIEDGDCIIDAGVCEGNFALKYVDIASHIYLFEMSPLWQEPLRHTFRNFEGKVTLINKAVSDITTEKTCCMDDVVQNKKVDFVKMDIEGAEVAAIHGAEKIFCNNNVKSSICCYHRNGDEEKIRKQLEIYGYRTSVSNGYMLFFYSDDTWELGDLRRGVVYGSR